MRAQKRPPIWAYVIILALLSGTVGWIARAVLPPRSTGNSQVAATIEQVRAHPESLVGKKVKLTGRLDECFAWECSICPEAMTAQTPDSNKCLALEFRPLVNGTGFGEEQQEEVFRFSSVILEADFNPSCWTGGCTDRQTVLSNARVLTVVKRRASKDGLWLGGYTPVIQVTGSTADQMKSAALRAGFPKNPSIRSFVTVAHSPRFVVCWSSPAFGDSDPGAWPHSLEGALYARSTLDFYRCNEVVRVDRQLVVQAS